MALPSPKTILNDYQEIKFNANNTISTEFNSLGKITYAVDLPLNWDGGILIMQSKSGIKETFKDVYDSDGSRVELVTAGAGDKIIGLTEKHLQVAKELRFFRFKTSVAPTTEVFIKILLR